MSSRPDWDTFFLGIAELLSRRATCLRRQCGAVLVKDHHIISSGYNGSPPGQPHCIDVGCEIEHGHCVRCLHAEWNTIISAARLGRGIEDSTLYIYNGTPCYTCAKMIASAGIDRVVCQGTYPDDRALKLLEDVGITLVILGVTHEERLSTVPCTSSRGASGDREPDTAC